MNHPNPLPRVNPLQDSLDKANRIGATTEANEPVPVVADDQVNDPPQELDDSEETMDKDDKEAISEDNILSDESEVGVRDKKTGSYAEPADDEEFGTQN